MSWFLYVLECRGGSLYTGISNDVAARYAAHAAGTGARYTRAYPPQRLLLTLPYADRSAASKAEYVLKQLTAKQKHLYVRACLEVQARGKVVVTEAAASEAVAAEVGATTKQARTAGTRKVAGKTGKKKPSPRKTPLKKIAAKTATTKAAAGKNAAKKAASKKAGAGKATAKTAVPKKAARKKSAAKRTTKA